MKIFTSILAACTISAVMAQSQGDWCATNHYYEEMVKDNPSLRIAAEKEQARLFANARAFGGAKAGSVITVPVVVHIIHDNGVGNISDAQVEDGIRIMNEDFMRINNDTNITRTIFKSVASEVGIQFKLAKLDPNGNCTKGILRINSDLTYDARNNVKSLSRWPIDKYMNVWLVSSIESFSGTGITLGFAQFPFFMNNNYGMVVRSDYWGTIGTSSSDGRTATHEAGHCFGLFHTFEGSCGGGCSTSGDQICDTPPTSANTFGCVPTQNTCFNDASGPSTFSTDVVDQIENYMSYDACQNMFTKDQAAVMESVFSNVSQLASLSSKANLIATGTDSSFTGDVCAPIAEFIYPDKVICENMSVTYVDISYNGTITNRTWNFPGGTPSTSADSIITVTYPVAGIYNASLTVSNSKGNDSQTHNSVVEVKPEQADLSSWFYSEGMEDNHFNDDWQVINNGGSRTWEVTNKAAFTGQNSVYINNFSGNTLDEIDEFISPSYDFSAVVNPELYFKVAYAKKISSNVDQLRVYYSIDCGQNWNIRYSKAGTLLETAPSQTSEFIPQNPEDWMEVRITVPASVRGSKNVIFRFEFTFDGGNNIFIDDINIQNPAGINEKGSPDALIELYPNPAGEYSTLSLDVRERLSNVFIYLTDMRGQKIAEVPAGTSFNAGKHTVSIPASTLAKGLYFVNVVSEQGRLVEKLVVK